MDLFSYSLVLVPVHLGMHWCLATIDMDTQSIVYYDSMGGNNKVSVIKGWVLKKECFVFGFNIPLFQRKFNHIVKLGSWSNLQCMRKLEEVRIDRKKEVGRD